jgi:hypothetical protein
VAFALFGKSLLTEWMQPPARGSPLGKFALFVYVYSLLYQYQPFSSSLSFCANSSKQIIQRLVGILFNQLDHALEGISFSCHKSDWKRHTSGIMGFPWLSRTYRKGISVLSCSLMRSSG